MLGDDGRFYVPESMVAVFCNSLIPRAFLITPNQFEAELLSGIKILSHESAVNAMIKLHKMGPKVVCLTSSEWLQDDAYQMLDSASMATNDGDTLPDNGNNNMYLNCYVLEACYDDGDTEASVVAAGSTSTNRGDSQHTSSNDSNGTGTSTSNSCHTRHKVRITRLIINKLAGHFTGTGDLVAGLMTAWVRMLGPGKAGEALDRVMGTLRGVLVNTIAIQSRRISGRHQRHHVTGDIMKLTPTCNDDDDDEIAPQTDADAALHLHRILTAESQSQSQSFKARYYTTINYNQPYN